MEQTVYIGVRLPKKLYDQLVARQKAQSLDVSLSAVVRNVLERGLERKNGKRR